MWVWIYRWMVQEPACDSAADVSIEVVTIFIPGHHRHDARVVTTCMSDAYT